MGNQAGPEYEFDVAMSFAGEDRELVTSVVDLLKAAEVRVFLDEDYKAELWGENLLEKFEEIYSEKARYAMVFVSQAYLDKDWCRHERRAALTRAFREKAAYVLPVRLEDIELPGLNSVTGYLDMRREGVDGVAAVFLKKWGQTSATPPTIERVPRSEVEMQQVLLDRPPGWEYLYLAGCLLQERDSLGERFQDHELGYAARNGTVIAEDDIFAFVRQEMNRALGICNMMMTVMNWEAQERAVGAPGEPGDADRIQHLARRWNKVYEEFLAWTARLRGTDVPSKYRGLVDALASYGTGPVQQYRKFVDDLVESVDQIPRMVAEEGTLHVEMALALEIPPEATAAYEEELHKLGWDGILADYEDD